MIHKIASPRKYRIHSYVNADELAYVQEIVASGEHRTTSDLVRALVREAMHCARREREAPRHTTGQRCSQCHGLGRIFTPLPYPLGDVVETVCPDCNGLGLKTGEPE